MTNPPDNTDLFRTLHIALATYPRGQSQKYIKEIEEYYKKFRENKKGYYFNEEETNLDGLYEPLIYHIFGSFDVAFISLIDNFKFTQKNFFPSADTTAEGANSVDTNSYQILTGILPPTTPTEEFRKYGEKTFVSITNLKLSNGFLVGNGQKLLNSAIDLIKKKLKTYSEKQNIDHIDSICLQSFSWFEITLILFIEAEGMNYIADIIGSIREATIKDLDLEDDKQGNYNISEKIIKKSLYYTYIEEKEKDQFLLDYHVFADSQSYLGVSFDKFSSENFDTKIEIQTQTEWQVKPGQLERLIQAIDPYKTDPDKEREVFVVTGKNDYWVQNRVGSLKGNQKLFLKLQEEEKQKEKDQKENKQSNSESIRSYIRNYKTRLMIRYNEGNNTNKKADLIIKDDPFRKNLSFNQIQIQDTYKNLKALKVSRHIRQKINKIFFNYNSGIKDPILCIYFNDFYYFLTRLRQIIDVEYHLFEKFIGSEPHRADSTKTVRQIEKLLEEFIDAFHEGYSMRMLNCYQFEEIFDFDLDLNSSIQQLLTTYNSIIADVANLLTDETNERTKGHPQVIQLNLRNTLSNSIAINYNAYHLTTPELVFFTMTKEILNGVAREPGDAIKSNSTSNNSESESNETKQISDFVKKLDKLFKSNTDPYIIDMRDQNLLIPQSYIIDFFQLEFVCNGDIELYEHWFWAYNFQVTWMYNTRGYYGDEYFKRELFRLVFLAELKQEGGSKKLSCPISEVANLWHRYHQNTVYSVKNFLYPNKFDNVNYISNINFRIEITGEINNRIGKIDQKYKINNSLDFNVEDAIDIRQSYHDWLDNIDPNQRNLRSLMYFQLKYFYKRSNGQLAVLRRDMKEGKPVTSFIKNNTHPFFYIDPLGGLFFTNSEYENEYYIIQSKVLKILWDYGLWSKMNFLKIFVP